MGKIHRVLMDEALRIRKEYLKEIQNLTNKEDEIKKYQKRLNDILENIEKYIIINKENDNNLTEEQISVDLKDELSDIEVTMNKIKTHIKTLDENISKLREQSSTLFNKIVKKHPELSKDEIVKEILFSIKN